MLRTAVAEKEGVPSGVCDLGASRPEVPEGPLWSWRSPAVSPRAVTAPTPSPRTQLAPARPGPGSPVRSQGSGVGKMGGVMEELGVGRAKPQIPGRDLGSSRGLGLGGFQRRRGVGPPRGGTSSGTGGAVRWEVAALGNSRCQRAEFDVWCGEALGKQSCVSGWGLGKWQRA